MSEHTAETSVSGTLQPPADGFSAQWDHACLAATMLAVAPTQLGGIHVYAGAGPVRDFWLEATLDLFEPGAPVRRMPPSIDDDRLIGGIDLPATLAGGRPVMQQGLLADCDGGVLLVPMAERLARASAAAIASVIDQGAVHLERHGVSRRLGGRFATILFDESGPEAQTPPLILRDRLAMAITLDGLSVHTLLPFEVDREDIHRLRDHFPSIAVDKESLAAISSGLMAAGIGSLRTLHQASVMARIHAALARRESVEAVDALAALSLVLGFSLSFQAPAEESVEEPLSNQSEEEAQTRAPPREQDQSVSDNKPGPDEERASPPANLDDLPLDEVLVEAVAGLNLTGVMDGLNNGGSSLQTKGDIGVAGAAIKSRQRGRVVGVRAGDPRRDGRLDVLATIRTAAPWQRLRQAPEAKGVPERLAIRREDFQVKTYEANAQTVVIFVVDASGSAAFHRMAEAKGAVEQLLADCYARRDQVAMIAFRHQGADLLLPPTRSLVRARRALAQLPGGGGTPLAAGLHSALMLALAERAKGATPYLVVLSDGRGNIALDGTPGRDAAREDAEKCARRIKMARVPTLFFDIAPRSGSDTAAALARTMGAVLQRLPRAAQAAGPSVITQSVRTLTAEGGRE
ncbi:MAG: magnesium chelatase subunit D [Pseudomonadota bacterium]